MKKLLSLKTLPIVLVSFILLNTGCATIVGHGHYSVTIKSNPAASSITVTNRKGLEVYKGTTPAIIDLKSSNGYFSRGIYHVKFHLDGYDDQTITIESKLNGWYIGNLLFGGPIGLLIVDPLTGAMYKIDDVNIESTLQQSSHAQVSNLEIIDIKNIPANWKSHLVAIKQ